MKRTVFKNQPFYWIVILIIGGLLIYNLYLIVSYANFITGLPIIIQSALMALIFLRHKYAKIGIKIWAILFLVAASGF